MKESVNHDRAEVSVILPVYNEASILESAVREITKVLGEYDEDYEIVIAEDGSTDGTDKKAGELSVKLSGVRHLHAEKRLGRGRALKKAFQQSTGQILVYMDVDLATDVRQLRELIRSVKEEDYDFATGSRLLPRSSVERSGTRNIASKTYNFMVRTVLGSKVKDHQCGFKAFRRESLMQLLEEVKASHWFWDTELLVRAQRKGYRIKEIPIIWKSGRETKVALLHDSLHMGWHILALWWHLKMD